MGGYAQLHSKGVDPKRKGARISPSAQTQTVTVTPELSYFTRTFGSTDIPGRRL